MAHFFGAQFFASCANFRREYYGYGGELRSFVLFVNRREIRREDRGQVNFAQRLLLPS